MKVFIKARSCRQQSFGKISNEGRTCGAWQIREPGYTCS